MKESRDGGREGMRKSIAAAAAENWSGKSIQSWTTRARSSWRAMTELSVRMSSEAEAEEVLCGGRVQVVLTDGAGRPAGP